MKVSRVAGGQPPSRVIDLPGAPSIRGTLRMGGIEGAQGLR
jgi:hypothetical protein